VFCTNCGKEVGNGSNFCTGCGKPTVHNSNLLSENFRMGRITFNRIGRFVGALVPINVYVDGNKVCSLDNDDSFTVDISFGIHRVTIENWGGVMEHSITVSEDYPNVYADIKLKMGLWTSKPQIVNIRNEK